MASSRIRRSDALSYCSFHSALYSLPILRAWTSARGTSLRSRVISRRRPMTLYRSDATPASASRWFRRRTSACRENAFFAARRALFASSTASSRLPRADLNSALVRGRRAAGGQLRRLQFRYARFRGLRPYQRLPAQPLPVRRRGHTDRAGNVRGRVDCGLAIRHGRDHSGTRIVLPEPRKLPITGRTNAYPPIHAA